MKIFVSGANGQLAHSVIRNVLSRGGGKSLVVGTRNVDTAFAGELAAAGVEVRKADFRDPALMAGALKGVDRALFIPTYDPNTVRLQQNLNAIEAARAAGVAHIIYPSFVNVESQLVEHSRMVHFPTEQALRASGLGFTILRHALYADTVVGDLQETLGTGVLRRPGGGARIAYIAREDLGLSAALVLLSEGLNGRVFTETMDRTYSGSDIAAAIAEVFGQPVRYESVAPEVWPQYMTDKWGFPAELAQSVKGTAMALAAGEFDIVSADYRQITGHSARTLQQFLEGVKKERSGSGKP